MNAPSRPTELVLAVEHYNRIMHVLEEDIPVEMEIEVRTTLHRGDPTDFNVIAEIPELPLKRCVFSRRSVLNSGGLFVLVSGVGIMELEIVVTGVMFTETMPTW